MIRFLRNKIFAGVAVLAASCFLPAHAAGYPDKPLRLIVPFAPGGTADVIARNVALRLGQKLGQPVIVENRAGASTAIGVKHAALAPADGYTLLYGGVSSQVMNPLINMVDFDPIKDFAPVSLINSLPLVLVVKPSLPVHTFPEFLALARSRPDAITYASAGAGTSNHLAGELLNKAAGVSLLHVPYKSSAPALNDLLGGHVDAMFDLVLTAAPQVKLGKVRALAITASRRSPLLPDVPTLRELGMPEGEVDVWTGLFAPKGTPKEIIARINQELVAILKMPSVQDEFAAYGAQAVPSTPEELDMLVKSDLKKWGTVVQAAGLMAKN